MAPLHQQTGQSGCWVYGTCSVSMAVYIECWFAVGVGASPTTHSRAVTVFSGDGGGAVGLQSQPRCPRFAVTHRRGLHPLQWTPGGWEWRFEVCFLPMLFCLSVSAEGSIFLPVFVCCREWTRSLGRVGREAIPEAQSSPLAVSMGHASWCVPWGSRAITHMFPRTHCRCV